MIIISDTIKLRTDKNKKTDTLNLRQKNSSSSKNEGDSYGTPPMLLDKQKLIGNRYQVIRELSSSGGQADIYLSEDIVSGEQVVLKIYRNAIFPKQDLFQKLVTLEHSNILRLKGFSEWNQRFIEVTEYCSGGTLNEGMPYKEKYLFDVVIPQFIEALHYLHQNGIIHRDIKPNNIFVKENKILLGDFGISSLIRGESTFIPTKTGRSTYEFAAPEINQGFFSKESDYYALGVSLIFLVSGLNPFNNLTLQKIAAIHASEDIPIPRCSDPFKTLIQGLVHKSRKKRWGYEEIRKWLNGEHVAVWPQEYNQQQSFSYKLGKDLVASNPQQLGEFMLKHPDLGKKHVRQPQLYESFNVYDQALASRLHDIRERAGNLEEMYVEVVYTLNPELPYRLLQGYSEVRTPAELAKLIDSTAQTWNAGKEQLYNGSIPAWLRAIGHAEIADNWQKMARNLSTK